MQGLVPLQSDIILFFLQENMTRMLMVTDCQDIIKRHQAQIITSLKDPDIRLNICIYMLSAKMIFLIYIYIKFLIQLVALKFCLLLLMMLFPLQYSETCSGSAIWHV